MKGGNGGPPTADGSPQRRPRSQALPVGVASVGPLVASIGTASCVHADVTASVHATPVDGGAGAFSHGSELSGGSAVDCTRASPVLGLGRGSPLGAALPPWAERAVPVTERSGDAASAGCGSPAVRCTKRRRVHGPESPSHAVTGAVNAGDRDQARAPSMSPSPAAVRQAPVTPAGSASTAHFARTPSGGEPGGDACGGGPRTESDNADVGAGGVTSDFGLLPAGSEAGTVGSARGLTTPATRHVVAVSSRSPAAVMTPDWACAAGPRTHEAEGPGRSEPGAGPGASPAASAGRVRLLSGASPAPATPSRPDAAVPVTPALRPMHITSPPALRGRKRARSAITPPTPHLTLDPASAAARAALANARWAGSLVQHRQELAQALQASEGVTAAVQAVASAAVTPAGAGAAAGAGAGAAAVADAPAGVAPSLTPTLVLRKKHKKKKRRDRCPVCRTKLRSLGFACRCGAEFCAKHRYAETHACSFDYATEHREKVRRENPEVRAAKLPKIL